MCCIFYTETSEKPPHKSIATLFRHFGVSIIRFHCTIYILHLSESKRNPATAISFTFHTVPRQRAPGALRSAGKCSICDVFWVCPESPFTCNALGTSPEGGTERAPSPAVPPQLGLVKLEGRWLCPELAPHY